MENIKPQGEIVIFNTENGEVNVQIDAVNETIWLTQKGMAELFGVDNKTISYHLGQIYDSEELVEEATIQFFEIVQKEGQRNVKRSVKFYNLDAIIAVGYRVNSKRATAFRIWATKTLREYLVKGFVLNDSRYVKGQSLTYFKELIERIRAIRLSEKVFYQQIRDIYTLSADYDANDSRAKEFFAKIQNKLLWAVSGHTAAEIVYYRANASLPQMGLTSTEDKGKVKASDVKTGKNYLTQAELNNLKLIVEQYLSFAEAQAQNHIVMYMADWETNLDIILTMNKKEILTHAGKITKEMAEKKAKLEYKKYKAQEAEAEHLESIKELSEAIKSIKP